MGSVAREMRDVAEEDRCTLGRAAANTQATCRSRSIDRDPDLGIAADSRKVCACVPPKRKPPGSATGAIRTPGASSDSVTPVTL